MLPKREISLSKKEREFRSECMEGKPVNKIPGIGETLGYNLEKAGYEKATDVYKKAQSMNFDKGKFQGWMAEVCGAKRHHAEACYKNLNYWSEQFDQGGASSSRDHSTEGSHRHSPPYRQPGGAGATRRGTNQPNVHVNVYFDRY